MGFFSKKKEKKEDLTALKELSERKSFLPEGVAKRWNGKTWSTVPSADPIYDLMGGRVTTGDGPIYIEGGDPATGRTSTGRIVRRPGYPHGGPTWGTAAGTGPPSPIIGPIGTMGPPGRGEFRIPETFDTTFQRMLEYLSLAFTEETGKPIALFFRIEDNKDGFYHGILSKYNADKDENEKIIYATRTRLEDVQRYYMSMLFSGELLKELSMMNEMNVSL